MNHAVLLVGYGIEGSQEYFILKNQWGTDWGEEGYMRIVNEGRGNGESGINIAPTIPTSNNNAVMLAQVGGTILTSIFLALSF